MATADNITTACLDGAARRLLQDRIPPEEAITELRTISRRPDLFAQAAGSALGGWRNNDVACWQGQAVAELLLEAGADPDATETRARAVAERLKICNVTGGTPRTAGESAQRCGAETVRTAATASPGPGSPHR